MQIINLPNDQHRQLTTPVYHQLKHAFTIYHQEYPEIDQWTLSALGTKITKHLYATLDDNTFIGIKPNEDNSDSHFTVTTEQLAAILTITES